MNKENIINQQIPIVTQAISVLCGYDNFDGYVREVIRQM
jgi:hypothetical protein